jgi:hydroxymethylglutaryl-CoA lyase
MDEVKIIECPRDAWQGLPKIIPTEEKVAYLRRLIESGFRHLDAVSFVAPKYVPQMADSEMVMQRLEEAGLVKLSKKANGLGASGESSRFGGQEAVAQTADSESQATCAEIIGIVVNEQGLERALHTSGVSVIGYPYSVSANFRRANANMSLSESRELAKKLRQATKTAGRNLVVYISMAFGNHYGEPWSPEVTEEALLWLKGIGVTTVSLADTVGTATPQEVGALFRTLKRSSEDMEVGVHLHSRAENAGEKVLAAYEAGCRRFDCALTGLGGCPFAGDDLVGNIPTEIVVSALHAQRVSTRIEPWAMLSAVEAAKEIRRQYAH